MPDTIHMLPWRRSSQLCFCDVLDRQTDKPLRLAGKQVLKHSNLTEDSSVESTARVVPVYKAFEIIVTWLCSSEISGTTLDLHCRYGCTIPLHSTTWVSREHKFSLQSFLALNSCCLFYEFCFYEGAVSFLLDP